jgi:hypothetical protein
MQQLPQQCVFIEKWHNKFLRQEHPLSYLLSSAYKLQAFVKIVKFNLKNPQKFRFLIVH